MGRLMSGKRPYCRKLFDLSLVPLSPKYTASLRLTPEKVRDLEDLDSFIRLPHEATDLPDIVKDQQGINGPESRCTQ